MDIVEKIRLDNLTNESVSVLRQKFINIDGEKVQAGDNIRNIYNNIEQDRQSLQKLLPDNYYKSIIAMWGDTPTITLDSEGNISD